MTSLCHSYSILTLKSQLQITETLSIKLGIRLLTFDPSLTPCCKNLGQGDALHAIRKVLTAYGFVRVFLCC
uniref:Uncharacterized protein n=1 Tax=Rhizophora mucronata TaxID=61149 RepID=A0A2P2LKM7_RHIMU